MDRVLLTTRTGMATEMGHIATMLAQTEQEPTPLQKEIAGVSRTLGIAVIVIAIVVGAVWFFTGRTKTITAYFPSTRGVYEDDTVRVLGVGVAHVAGAKNNQLVILGPVHRGQAGNDHRGRVFQQ